MIRFSIRFTYYIDTTKSVTLLKMNFCWQICVHSVFSWPGLEACWFETGCLDAVSAVFFFRFLDPNSNQFFRLTQRNFEANSAFFLPNSKFRRFWTSIFTNSYNFLHLTEIFGIFKQKTVKFVLNQTKSWPNSAKSWSNSAKSWSNSAKILSNSANNFI